MIPGFGLDAQLVDQTIRNALVVGQDGERNVPAISRIISVMQQAVDEDGPKRAPLKIILSELKDAESLTLKRLKEQQEEHDHPVTL